MSLYRVTGQLAYRDHKPGDVFEAVLDPESEARALWRGNITLLERSTPKVRPGSFTLPAGWHLTPPSKEQ
jgi:hypothetical protein